MKKLLLIPIVLLALTDCRFVNKKPVASSNHIEVVEDQEGPPSEEPPPQEEVNTPDIVPNPGETAADQVRKVQDTKIPDLVAQRIEEIKKAASEGFRLYTETASNHTKAMKLAEEFEKRGFKVQVRKAVNSETYTILITW